MKNVCPEITKDQYIIYLSGEALGSNVHIRRSGFIIKYPQRYDPGCGSTI